MAEELKPAEWLLKHAGAKPPKCWYCPSDFHLSGALPHISNYRHIQWPHAEVWLSKGLPGLRFVEFRALYWNIIFYFTDIIRRCRRKFSSSAGGEHPYQISKFNTAACVTVVVEVYLNGLFPACVGNAVHFRSSKPVNAPTTWHSSQSKPMNLSQRA